ncbi:MAG: damage-control phosphatase ARMT1 family protein, partial [Actinomycetota bacterium]
MKTYIECIPCTLNQCINTLNVSRVSGDLKEKTISKLLEKLKDLDYNLPPAYNSDLAYETCKEITKIEDPYYNLKRKYNRLALEIYPELVKIVNSSSDPLYAAAKVSVEGNVIDLGINLNKGKKIDFKKIIDDINNIPLAINDYDKFKESLEKAENILYISDNAGEIVFDKVFVQELAKLNKNIVFSVKSGPIINDATIEDARE